MTIQQQAIKYENVAERNRYWEQDEIGITDLGNKQLITSNRK